MQKKIMNWAPCGSPNMTQLTCIPKVDAVLAREVVMHIEPRRGRELDIARDVLKKNRSALARLRQMAETLEATRRPPLTFFATQGTGHVTRTPPAAEERTLRPPRLEHSAFYLILGPR